MRSIRAASVSALLFIAATACRDASTAPADADNLLAADVAVVAGDAVFEDVNVIYTQVGAFGVPTGVVERTGGWQSDCPFDQSTGRFNCPTITREHMTLSRSYAFADAAGAAQAAYSATTTERANFVTSMSGNVARDGWSATIERARNITVSGLVGAETQHTINGVGSNTESRSRHTDGGDRTYEMSAVATFANVVVPFPRSRGAWPLSGTVTREITATRDGPAGGGTRSRTTVVTFNGTRFATMVVGDRSFTVDLATGRTAPRRVR